MTKSWWHQKVPLFLAIWMSMAVHRSNTDGIAQCGMFRATREATGCRHQATTCSVLPQQPPGQQQTKQWRKNGPTLLAVLMAAVVRQYDTMPIAWWRRSGALVEATECRHRASIAADRCKWSCICQFFFSFFIVNLSKRLRVNALAPVFNTGMTYQTKEKGLTM